MDLPGTKSLKRKLVLSEEDDVSTRKLHHPNSHISYLPSDISKSLHFLYNAFSSSSSDRSSASNALIVLSEIAKDRNLAETIVDYGGVAVLVRILQRIDMVVTNDGGRDYDTETYLYEMEKNCALVLSHLAFKPEYQILIVDVGALHYLVELLKRRKSPTISQELFSGLLRRAADAITCLAHENTNIRNLVRLEGGIPPLVELLEFNDANVQRAAAAALRTLAFRNDDNKYEIVSCNAIPSLVLMLESGDPSINYEAVGAIGNIVHSSPEYKIEVLEVGALQPVISLLSSSSLESRREAALLIGQFATTNADCNIHIAQRGAINPLIAMLHSPELDLLEMSTFALGRLAQDTHNQAGIGYNGGITPLLDLLGSENGVVQHNAAFALYGLSDNEDNVAVIIKAGGFQKLQYGHFNSEPTQVCVLNTIRRLEEKMEGQVLKRVLYAMRFGEKCVQICVSLALAHLCSHYDRKTIFIDNNGLELLLDLLQSENLNQKREASEALHTLAMKGICTSIVEPASTSPPKYHLNKFYINNPEHSDIEFIIEGKSFYAHRICLVYSSEIFCAMLDGGYKEKEAKTIEIPNIKWDVFELIMRYLYIGVVDIDLDVAPDLLKAADQYLLDGLKALCQDTLVDDISVENVSQIYEMGDTFNASPLRYACIIFVLENIDSLSTKPWYPSFLHSIVPDIREFFSILITHPHLDYSCCRANRLLMM